MERGGKSGGDGAEKEEKLGEKLRRRDGGGPSTPVTAIDFARASIITSYPSPSSSSSPSAGPISARKLAAALWEFHQYVSPSKMHRTTVTNGPPRLRRLKEKDAGGGGGGDGDGLEVSRFMADPCPSSPDQPASASSLRRHVTASFMQHHRSIERISRAIQPPSPVSCGSSMEMTPYNPAVTPSSSLDFNGRAREPHYSLKTSTELLKVLNRIWSLEEQHVSNISLIRAIKAELDHGRARIKELLRDQATGRKEMDALMKQIAEDKLVRKGKEQEKIHAAVQSAREELEDERKLRKRSESLHRKLARELSDAKSSLSSAVKGFEVETESRKLMEDLCDEFAIGIRDYEHEVHALKKEWTGESDQSRLILHVAESWLDERVQMKLEEKGTSSIAVVEKLRVELETFLRAKRKGTLNVLPKEQQRSSLESVPLKEATSGPQDLGGGDDGSDESESNCFELKRQNNNEKTEEDPTKAKVVPRGRRKQHPRKEEVKGLEDDSAAVDDFIKSHLAMSGGGGGRMHPELECGEPSWRTQPSPVRQWMAKLSSPDLVTAESTSKLPPSGSLKAKLMEARSKGQRVRSKPAKGFSQA